MSQTRAVPALLVLAATLQGQPNGFAGGYFGISTLSADGRTDVAPGGARFSSYKPENGPTIVGFAGRHLTDYFSLMGSYGWNRNSVALATGVAGSTSYGVTQGYRGNVHTFIGEGMLYFRPRKSRIRPYLTAGAGLAHIEAVARGSSTGFGPSPSLPTKISQTGPAFRVAVGIDLFVTRHTAIRYSFSETLQGNPFSSALTPPAPRKLANFQNWFGAAFYF